MAVAINQESSAPWSHFKPAWHRTAPRNVVKKYGFDDPLGGWTAWQKHLSQRKRPVSPAFHQGKEPPLLWGFSPEAGPAGSAVRLDMDAAVTRVLEEDAATTAPDIHYSLEILALGYAAPELAQKLPAKLWWQLVERLHDIAGEAQQHRIDWETDPNDVLRHQLLAGELALVLSYLLPEIRPLRDLRKSARSVFSESLGELTDGEGLPHARLLPLFGALFACWTRARWMGDRLDRGPWSRSAEYQYQWLLRHAIRLADEGGRFLLAPRTTAWSEPMFSMTLDLVGDDGDCAAASVALPGRVVPKHIKFKMGALPAPSLNSDWSGITVMSDGWSNSDIRFAVSYADDPVQMELAVQGEKLFAGPWSFETACDGEPVQAVAEWEELCWQSDKLSDFLELSVELSHGLRLERQLLLGKKDRVLYMADIVVAADRNPRRLQHTMHLPLDPAVRWHRETETRDGRLLGDKLAAAVMPLALPEWRTDPRGGDLIEESGRLVLRQESNGRAMCCPLFFDLKPGRTKKERTWRQLTVAEWMEVLPRDAAVGFRAQSGGGQWLVYRSLGPAGNRTVLGQNIAGEFCAGRFQSSGKLKEWLEIEAL